MVPMHHLKAVITIANGMAISRQFDITIHYSQDVGAYQSLPPIRLSTIFLDPHHDLPPIVSSMVMIGKNLASTIHLLKDSHILLSTESQLEPNLNQALLQCCGWVFIIACAPAGVN